MWTYIYIFIERITSNTAQTLGQSSPPDTEGKETDIIQQQPEVLEYLHIPIPVYPGWSGLCEHNASGFRQTVTQRWIFAYHGRGDGKPCLQFVLHPAEKPQSDDREAWEYLQLLFWAPGTRHRGSFNKLWLTRSNVQIGFYIIYRLLFHHRPTSCCHGSVGQVLRCKGVAVPLF